MIPLQQMAQAADETDSFVPRNKVTALTAGPLTPEPPLEVLAVWAGRGTRTDVAK